MASQFFPKLYRILLKICKCEKILQRFSLFILSFRILFSGFLRLLSLTGSVGKATLSRFVVIKTRKKINADGIEEWYLKIQRERVCHEWRWANSRHLTSFFPRPCIYIDSPLIQSFLLWTPSNLIFSFKCTLKLRMIIPDRWVISHRVFSQSSVDLGSWFLEGFIVSTFKPRIMIYINTYAKYSTKYSSFKNRSSLKSEEILPE